MCPFCDDPQCIEPAKCTCYYPCANQFCPALPASFAEDDADPDDRPYFDEIPDDDGDYYEALDDSDD